jgi:methyltransferase (TIGR00027 family)
MKPGQASITALVTAYCRAYHASQNAPKIFDDSLVGKMFSDAECEFFNQNLAGLLKVINPQLAATDPDSDSALAYVIQNHSGPITLSRSRYAEDCLEQAINQGVRQYVFLGAGLDTFAYRRPDLLEKVQVFELDHPDTQSLKVERLRLLGIEMPPQLHFIPIDFTKESFTEALLSSSFNPHTLSFFSWLGVTYYLMQDIFFSVLGAIAQIAAKGSTVVFDYMEQDAFNPQKASRRVHLLQAIASQTGEPMISGFNPLDLPPDINNLGFYLLEDLNLPEIEKRYFQNRSDGYHAFEQVHFARAVVK